MKNVYNLNEWQIDKSIPNNQRFVEVSIRLKYPDPKQFIDFKPKQRIKKINGHYKHDLQRLLALNFYEQCEITGTKKRPTGINAKVSYPTLAKLNKLDFIGGIHVKAVDHAIHVKPKEIETASYYCVKMTVVIDFEGISSKKEKTEIRFVIIKASSHEEAYEKLEKQKDSYAEPYLNSDGRFVRWRIESFDDSYETSIYSPKDLDDPEGVEVFSKFKSRKAKTKTVWDGKS